jgi:hypothetical protein
VDKRLHKATRLLGVQEQLHKMAEWKAAALQRQAAELQQAQAALIEILNDDEMLHGLFVDARSRRLQSLAKEETQVKAAQSAQNKVVFEKAMQVKRTERMVETLTVEHRRAQEKKDYLLLLDRLMAKPDASLP